MAVPRFFPGHGPLAIDQVQWRDADPGWLVVTLAGTRNDGLPPGEPVLVLRAPPDAGARPRPERFRARSAPREAGGATWSADFSVPRPLRPVLAEGGQLELGSLLVPLPGGAPAPGGNGEAAAAAASALRAARREAVTAAAASALRAARQEAVTAQRERAALEREAAARIRRLAAERDAAGAAVARAEQEVAGLRAVVERLEAAPSEAATVADVGAEPVAEATALARAPTGRELAPHGAGRSLPPLDPHGAGRPLPPLDPLTAAGAPWVRHALRRVAAAEPDVAGELMLALLAAQHLAALGPLAYVVEVAGRPAREVRVAGGRTWVGAPAQDPPRAVPLTLASLSRLVTRRGPWGRVRDRGRPRRALRALGRAPLSFGALEAAEVALPAALAYALLSAAVPPAWTAGHAFTVEHDGCLVGVGDGGLVVLSAPAAVPPAATVTAPPERTLAFLLGREGAAAVGGHGEAAALLQTWTRRLEAGDAPRARPR